MKKQNVSLLALLLTASVFFASCHNSANKRAADALGFDSLRVNQTVHLFGDTAKPACNLIVNLAYAATPADSIALRDSLNAYLLATCLGHKYVGMEPAEAVKQYADSYIAKYRELEPLYEQDEKENAENTGAWYSYYRQVEGHVQLCTDEVLVYRVDYNEYTGGAHGNYLTTFLNLDLKALCPLRLDDLFAAEYQEPLTDLLWEQLAEDIGVSTRQEAEDLGYGSTGELTPTENFCLGHEGITFHYNIYEIAPYVMGATEITLPWQRISHLLGERNDIIKQLQ